MAVRDIFKVSRKTFFNPGGWLDYEGLKNENKVLASSLGALFTKPTVAHEENFEQAQARLQLSDQAIKSMANRYFLYALLFILVGGVVLGYSLYLLFTLGSFLAWLMGTAVTAYCFVLAFRFHFWSLQLTKRQLGLTFADWKRHLFGR